MNRATNLERLVTAWLHADASSVGSDRVLAAALRRIETTPQERYRSVWVRNEMEAGARLELDRTGRFLIAAVVLVSLAVVGINLLLAYNERSGASQLPTPNSGSRLIYKGDDGAYPARDLAVGRHYAQIDRLDVTFDIPTRGWSSGPSTLPFALLAPSGISLSLTAPVSVYTDPCEPRVVPSLAGTVPAYVAALTSIRRVDATAPVAVSVGGQDATYIELTVRASVQCAVGRPLLWDTTGSPGHDRPVFAAGSTYGIWVVDLDGGVALMEAGPLEDATDEAVAEIRRLVESMTVDLVRIPDAMPSAGPVQPGWYSTRSGPGLGFRLLTTGWVHTSASSDTVIGTLTKGVPPASDSAVIRFSEPIGVYPDPCGHELVNVIGPAVSDLATAMTRIPGTDVVGPTSVGLRWSTARHLAMTIQDDIKCDVESFYMWTDGLGDVRTPTAAGSTIRVWIFNPNNREVFGRHVVEAETFQGATPALMDEVERIVRSIDHGG